MKAEELLVWFKEEVLPILIKNQHLSEEEDIQGLEKCEFEFYEKAVNSFSSDPTFTRIILKTPAGPVSRYAFIKFQNQDPVFRDRMKLLLQFQNEVTMYNTVLPAFAEFLTQCVQNDHLLQQIIIKCYFAMHNSEDPEKSIVILKDGRKDGYTLSTAVTELDLEHCLISFERLAQFHAISYAMKFRDSKVFDQLKDSCVQVWFENDEISRKHCEEFMGYCATRGIIYLTSQKSSEVPACYLNNIKKILNHNGLFDLIRSLRSPKEPLSVICHGDFNRNNILYKYVNGKPIDAKLIDFQTFLYGSPNLDLSFFIYMNTTLELREKHFDEMYRHYHSTLIKTVALILGESEGSIAIRLPLEEFREDFGRVAITAYVTVAFFLPVMMAPRAGDFESDLKEKSFKEVAMENLEQGGDVVSKRVAEVIVDFYRRKFYM